MAGSRGNSGIEHRNIDTILQAYNHWGHPNYAIYCGNDQRDYYDGGNMDEGVSNLLTWLQIIEQGGTSAVYTLKVYGKDVVDINSKSPHKGSTTFSLAEYGGAIGRTDNNVTIVPNSNNGGNQMIFKQILDGQQALIGAITQQQQKASDEKFERLLEMLEKRELEGAEKLGSTWERIGEMILTRPDGIAAAIGSIANIFMKKPPETIVYEQQAPQGQLAGSNNDNMKYQSRKPTEQQQAPRPEYTVEEIEQYNNRMDTALEALLTRFGFESVANMLEKVAGLSDMKIAAMKTFL